MLNKYALLYVTAVSLFLSCKTAEFGYKVIGVNGMIYDFANRPVSNSSIYIDSEYKAETDINGRFAIAKVPAGDYEIQVIKKGYEVYTGKIHLNDRKQILYLRIPSLQQLLELADNALEKNQIEEALHYVKRAFSIDDANTELLFYAAIVQFRLGNIRMAEEYLEQIKSSGVHDMYLEQFIQDIHTMQGVRDEE